MNIRSGIKKTLITGIVAFILPVVVLGIIGISIFAFADYDPIDRQNDIKRLPTMILLLAVGCAFLFSLAALATYLPKHGFRFIQTLLIISPVLLVTVMFTGPRPEYKRIVPNGWIAVMIPIVAGVVTSLAIVVWCEYKYNPSKLETIDNK